MYQTIAVIQLLIVLACALVSLHTLRLACRKRQLIRLKRDDPEIMRWSRMQIRSELCLMLCQLILLGIAVHCAFDPFRSTTGLTYSILRTVLSALVGIAVWGNLRDSNWIIWHHNQRL